jgi:large subunit ribosomal protein L17
MIFLDGFIPHPSSLIPHHLIEIAMRHLRAGKKLGRNPKHRLALFRNLTMALIRHERIVTTVPKAKAVRPFVERLITLAVRAAQASEGTAEGAQPDKALALHYRRLVISRLGPSGLAAVRPPGADNDEGVPPDLRSVVRKLFEDLGPRFKDRPGGYTRIIKRHERRLGDAGETAFLELLKEGETKVKAKQAAEAPAPAVEEEEVEEEEQAESEEGQSEPTAAEEQAEAKQEETAKETPASTPAAETKSKPRGEQGKS